MLAKTAIFGLVSASFVVGATHAAQATTFTFDDRYYGATTITQEVDGITMILSNPSGKPFVSDGFGICVLGDLGDCQIGGFEISFSKAVKLLSYEVTFSTTSGGSELGADRTVTLSDGVSTSVETGTWQPGVRTFANQFTVDANAPISVTAGGLVPEDYLQWNNFEVVSAASVPEPTTVLGVLTLGSLGALARRKRAS